MEDHGTRPFAQGAGSQRAPVGKAKNGTANYYFWFRAGIDGGERAGVAAAATGVWFGNLWTPLFLVDSHQILEVFVALQMDGRDCYSIAWHYHGHMCHPFWPVPGSAKCYHYLQHDQNRNGWGEGGGGPGNCPSNVALLAMVGPRAEAIPKSNRFL